MNKKTILTVVIVVAMICACISGGILIKNVLADDSAEAGVQMPGETAVTTEQTGGNEETGSEIADTQTETQTETETASPEEPSTETASSTESEIAEPEPIAHPYADYFKQNEDMVAWLTIPGMDIDYPVMQTPGDEEYYLRKGFDKKKDQNGCLIMDTDSSLSPLGTNLMIHGHNMKSGKMFGTLMKYKEEEFFKEHKTITLYTEECERTYEVMAVFYSQVYRKSDNVFKFYKFFQADNEKEFNDFYDNIMDMKLYDTGVTAEYGDHLLTLVTCAYHVENGRFVVVAKEVASGAPYAPIE